MNNKKNETQKLLKAVLKFHKDNSTRATYLSFKKYLDPKATTLDEHSYRVYSEYETMNKRKGQI